jgi:hypothetical protein
MPWGNATLNEYVLGASRRHCATDNFMVSAVHLVSAVPKGPSSLVPRTCRLVNILHTLLLLLLHLPQNSMSPGNETWSASRILPRLHTAKPRVLDNACRMLEELGASHLLLVRRDMEK